jgi:hypothetical protein
MFNGEPVFEGRNEISVKFLGIRSSQYEVRRAIGVRPKNKFLARFYRVRIVFFLSLTVRP